MSRQARRALPLEMKWRAPEQLPPPGQAGGVEIAFLRFLDETLRITVAPTTAGRVVPHDTLVNVPVDVVVEGWHVLVNGESQGMEPVPFLDACFAGWGLFGEYVPNVARVLCQSIAVRARREGWDEGRMAGRVRYARDAEEHERGPTTEGAAVGGADP